MRVKLSKGKQKELIFLAKGNWSWKEFAKFVSVPESYLSGDLKREEILLSEELYGKLCKLAKNNFDDDVIEKLKDDWGKSKGGLSSRGSTIKLSVSDNKENLAEFIGIILGDGNIGFYKKGSKVGVYQVKIAGDYIKDKEYHLNYIKPLCESLFNLNVGENINPEHGERFLFLSSKELVEFLVNLGLKPGNKIENNISVPSWILKDRNLLKYCLRGLIDTDGSVFRMSKKDPCLIRISFCNHNVRLLSDVRNAFVDLGFHPSKIIQNNVYLSRKSDIEKYLREIGFSNWKHVKRLQEFKNSPVV